MSRIQTARCLVLWACRLVSAGEGFNDGFLSHGCRRLGQRISTASNAWQASVPHEPQSRTTLLSLLWCQKMRGDQRWRDVRIWGDAGPLWFPACHARQPIVARHAGDLSCVFPSLFCRPYCSLRSIRSLTSWQGRSSRPLSIEIRSFEGGEGVRPYYGAKESDLIIACSSLLVEQVKDSATSPFARRRRSSVKSSGFPDGVSPPSES